MAQAAYQDDFQDGLEWDEDEEEAQAQDGDNRDVSLLAEDQYFRQVYWSEPLPREEEAPLFRRVQRGRLEQEQSCPNQWVLSLAKHARDRLVEGFQPLVIHIAQRYVRLGRNLDVMDAIQTGNLGLLKAIELHEAEKGGFTGLASRCISYAISDELWRHGNAVHYTDDGWKKLRKLRRAEQRLWRVLGGEPTVHQLAVEMQVSEATVCELRGWWQMREMTSLYALSVFEEGDVEERYNFLPLWEQATPPLGSQASCQAVCEVCEQVLTERQRRVIALLYEEGSSYLRVAQLLGVTEWAIRSTEAWALRKLRQVLAPEELSADGMCQESEYYLAAQAAVVLGVTQKRFDTLVVHEQIRRYSIEVMGKRCEGHTRYCYGKAEIDALAEKRQRTARQRSLPDAARPAAAHPSEVA